MALKLFLSIQLILVLPLFSENYNDDEIIKDCFWSNISNLPKGKRLPVGLALSGGGARAFAHTGIIETLNSISFPIDYIAGTSMGAVVGGLYSSGMPQEKLWEFGRNVKKLKISKDFSKIKVINLLLTESFIEPVYIRKFVDENFKGKNIEDFPIPFACVAMDIMTGEKIVFSKGPSDIAIKASVNLPGIFKPLKYKHRYLVDGGVVAFLPVDIVKQMGAKWIIAGITENTLNEMPNNVLTTLLQVIDIRGGLLSEKSAKEADFLIKPPVSDIKVAEFEECVSAAEKAIKETYKNLDKIIKQYIIDNIQKKADII